MCYITLIHHWRSNPLHYTNLLFELKNGSIRCF